MSKKRRVAVALRMDLPYADHLGVFSGVLRYAHEHPQWNCIFDLDPGAMKDKGPASAGRYDGVIARVVPSSQPRLEKLNVPLVNTMYATRQRLASVSIDTHQCGALAGEHLIDRGFQRLAYLGMHDMEFSDDIGQGFAQAVAKRGHSSLTAHVKSGQHANPDFWQSAKRDLEPFLDTFTPPVGVFVAIPLAARMLITLCENRGWNVPRDVAIVCMDMAMGVLEFKPQITHVNSRHERVGYEAAAMLDQLMNGETLSATHVVVPPGGIVTCESTDYFAVEDDVVAAALRFIASHLSDRLTVDRIADELAVSSRTLQRRFNEAVGHAVSEEIRRLRLESAKRLLRSHELSISQVARRAGFGSRFTLNDIFRQQLGVTPGAYRKSLTDDRP